MSRFQLYKNDVFLMHCEKELNQLVSNIKHVHSALLATTDGFTLCSTMNENVSLGRLGAASSSFLELGVSLSKEFGLEQCKSINMDSETGKVWLSQISTNEHSLVLLIQCGANVMLGQLLYSSNKIRESIITQLKLNYIDYEL